MELFGSHPYGQNVTERDCNDYCLSNYIPESIERELFSDVNYSSRFICYFVAQERGVSRLVIV